MPSAKDWAGPGYKVGSRSNAKSTESKVDSREGHVFNGVDLKGSKAKMWAWNKSY